MAPGIYQFLIPEQETFDGLTGKCGKQRNPGAGQKIYDIQEKTMRVGICDDELLWREKAKDILEEYGKEKCIEIECLCFGSEEEMDSYTESPPDVLFMDISLEDNGETKRDGIQAASRINERWRGCQIVYLTNYLFYATDVYQTEHTYFVLKEQFKERVGEIFEKIFHNMDQKYRKLMFSVIGGGTVVLAPEEILYFERDKRITRIVTYHRKYEIWDKLGKVMEMLPETDFIRCHNSYIVYFPSVKEMDKGQFIMNDGTKIAISRNRAKEVKNAFIRWALTQMS